MIRKLRVKLIIASMFSFFIVLFILMGTIGILNYRRVLLNADSILELLAENDGAFPNMKNPFAGKPEKPFWVLHEGDGHLNSPELPYESRYFSVRLSKEGELISASTEKIAAVDIDTAVEYAKTVWQSGREKGFVGDYRYLVYPAETEIHIIFLDWGRNLESFRSLLVTGAGVSAVGLLSVLVLMILLSERIVKPFSENYEKQKQFVTDAGHELKTPLTIIDADAEILEMDFGNSEWLTDIRNQTKRLAELTNSLILLSRMEEERTQIRMIEFPLSDLAEETVETFRALAKTQNKTLTGRIQPMVSIHGDEKLLCRLITILLDNAVKYSEPGGTISLTLEKQRNLIRLCVFNTTEYIARNHLEHLFDRFYRTDQSRNSQTGGYGLGLSIAAAIVYEHKGKIAATTEDEKSLLMTVTLPA